MRCFGLSRPKRAVAEHRLFVADLNATHRSPDNRQERHTRANNATARRRTLSFDLLSFSVSLLFSSLRHNRHSNRNVCDLWAGWVSWVNVCQRHWYQCPGLCILYSSASTVRHAGTLCLICIGLSSPTGQSGMHPHRKAIMLKRWLHCRHCRRSVRAIVTLIRALVL